MWRYRLRGEEIERGNHRFGTNFAVRFEWTEHCDADSVDDSYSRVVVTKRENLLRSDKEGCECFVVMMASDKNKEQKQTVAFDARLLLLLLLLHPASK